MLTSQGSREVHVVEHRVCRVSSGQRTHRDDALAAEEPLEIRLIWQQDGTAVRKNVAVTMRTPGDDFDLATGFLFGEGIIAGRDDIADVSHCTDEDEEQVLNIVNVTLRPGLIFDASRLDRNFYTSSSCGVCGKAALAAIEVQGCTVLPSGFEVEADVVSSLPCMLRGAQDVFERTGGLHAAGVFDACGSMTAIREDVGRHNAVDKVIGAQMLAGRTSLDQRLLMLSGRASFELVQNALMARIPIVAAIGAPSSLAVQVAEAFGVTLLGFVRNDSFNIYSGGYRILRPVSPHE